MYIVDKYDVFVLPDSAMCLLQIENVIKSVKKFKIRMLKYYHQLIKTTHKVTQPQKQIVPCASPTRNVDENKSANQVKVKRIKISNKK
ncbi:13747_t:CDS:2 [Entrophospora sp. SA101]|nr:13747_t:CDS:2 [Entrophospora sp. SA101]CAJ0839774.1 9071_t:CDS:2 [Entrophospora sp. SA101]